MSLDDLLGGKGYDNSKYEKILANLKKIPKKKLPKTESKLKVHLKTLKIIEEIDLDTYLEALYKNKIISKGNSNRLSYTL